MKALFTSLCLVVLLVSVVGCAAHQPARTPEVVRSGSDAMLCSDCLVYDVYQHTVSEIIVVGSRDIPEGREPTANELRSLRILRGNSQGVGPGMLIDISAVGVVRVRHMHPAFQSPDFENIHLALEQEFRDKKGRWHQLIKPFLLQEDDDEAYQPHQD